MIGTVESGVPGIKIGPLPMAGSIIGPGIGPFHGALPFWHSQSPFLVGPLREQ
jgi:hypothetical protein